MKPYADDAVVKRLTEQLVASGTRVFQIFQRGDEREHAAFLLHEMKPPRNARILDVGCGVGEVARLMKAARTDLAFTLLNISPAQLAMCPAEFDQVCASGENIPLADESFDAAMALYSMGNMDKDAALAEMRRVVRPGGVVFVADIEGDDLSALGYTAHEWEGVTPADMNTEHFRRLVPDFHAIFPKAKPVIYRETVR
jgi:ubiquinone/menaquinone biosynthesis C-methylase UbiE